MLSRQLYEAIAETLRDAREEGTADEAVDVIVSDLATILKADNPRFDREKFVTAAARQRRGAV